MIYSYVYRNIWSDTDTVTEIGSQSMISDPMGWDMLPDDNVMTPAITGDKHYNDLRKKIGLAQDETLR